MLKAVGMGTGAATTIAPGTPISGGTGSFTTLSASTSFTSTGNWGLQATLGKIGQGGRVDFIRGDTGGVGAYIGYHIAGAGDTIDIVAPLGNIRMFSGGVQVCTVLGGGSNGLGSFSVGGAAGTARLSIAAGTATALQSPLKFNTGPLLTVPEAGAEEFLTNARYYTGADGVRRRYAVNSNVINLQGFTVATLPVGTPGDKAYVTDALAPAYLTTVVGGGAVYTEVFRNASAWVCT